MGYNAEANTFERLPDNEIDIPNDKRNWTRFTEGEHVDLKGIIFRVHEVGESRIVLKPVKAV